jgi:predicted lipoprotein with Yx(FWY)xxD motif
MEPSLVPSSRSSTIARGFSVRRNLVLLVTTLAVASLPPTLADAGTKQAKLQLRKTSVGTILVNGRGYTLYAFTTDRRNFDSCVAKAGCLAAWPAVSTGGKPTAGRGVNSQLIGTIKLKNGTRQVTYAGRPLYTYIADRSPGQTTFVNILQFRGRWPAVDAAGHEVN